MAKRLCDIIGSVLNVIPSEINDQSGPETIDRWDSFNGYILLDEIESEYNIKFSLDEAVNIKAVSDIKNILKNRGVVFE